MSLRRTYLLDKIMMFKTFKVLTLSILCILPHTAMSKTIIMDCDGAYFKYSKSFWSNATVMQRNEADWEPWCLGNVKVTDKGAKCDYVMEKEIGETIREYYYVDQTYINTARQILSKRHNFCRQNKDHSICKPIDKTSALERITFEGSENLYETEPEPSWLVDCRFMTRGSPNYEKKSFFNLDLSTYTKMHMPKMGDQLCSKSSRFVVSEIKKINATDTLDFLLLVQNIDLKSAATSKKRVSCKLVE